MSIKYTLTIEGSTWSETVIFAHQLQPGDSFDYNFQRFEVISVESIAWTPNYNYSSAVVRVI